MSPTVMSYSADTNDKMDAVYSFSMYLRKNVI